jgi:hypothetical protein
MSNTKSSQKAKNFFVISLCLIGLFIANAQTSQVIGVSTIGLSLTTPVWANTGESFQITATTVHSARIKIYVDATLIGSRTGTSLTVSYTPNKISKHEIKATASIDLETQTRIKYTRTQFPETNTWYLRAQDYARSPQNTLVYDVGMEFLEYGYVAETAGVDGTFNTVSEIILALNRFAKDVLEPHWEGGDGDALTAYEGAELFRYFDGATDDETFFINHDYNPGDPDYDILDSMDCRDMSALISGIATNFGVPSRMVSVDEVQNHDHVFAELYGLTVNNNNGWFLIDPASGTGQHLDSYTTLSTVNFAYSGAGTDNVATRFRFIWGMDSSGWGIGISDPNQQTSWLENEDAPNQIDYSTNPWGITVTDPIIDFDSGDVSPASGSSISTRFITVSATPSSEYAMYRVKFYIDNVYKYADYGSPYSYTFDSAPYTVYGTGWHTVKFTAEDVIGNAESVSISLYFGYSDGGYCKRFC